MLPIPAAFIEILRLEKGKMSDMPVVSSLVMLVRLCQSLGEVDSGREETMIVRGFSVAVVKR
jgi:hypothetical protein